MSYRRILVRATNWVGDAVMSLPALHALRASFPAAKISILARPWVADIYGREPFCDELIPYTAPKGRRGFSEKWGQASRLRTGDFDCAVLLQNAFEAAAIVFAARIPVRIGYARDGRSPLLSAAIPVPRKGDIPAHQRFYYLELLKRAGLIPAYSLDSPVTLTGAADAAVAGRRHFAAEEVRGPVIGVSPGAAYGTAKRWLPERFAESASRLARERGATVALFGSPDEAALCEAVRRALAATGVPVHNFGGRTALGKFVEMAAACELFLTNDSGAMHIAYALGLPTVAIFGATDHIATGPVGPNTRIVREPVDCSPCLLRECPIDHRCMTRVSAERVAIVALDLLK